MWNSDLKANPLRDNAKNEFPSAPTIFKEQKNLIAKIKSDIHSDRICIFGRASSKLGFAGWRYKLKQVYTSSLFRNKSGGQKEELCVLWAEWAIMSSHQWSSPEEEAPEWNISETAHAGVYSGYVPRVYYPHGAQEKQPNKASALAYCPSLYLEAE